MKRFLLLVLTLYLCLTCNSCKKSQIEKDYPILQETKVIIRYTNIYDAFDILKKEQAILMFGFKSCPWCKYAIRYVNDVAYELNYQTVFYLDILKLRDQDDENHEKYEELYSLIKENIGNPLRIIAPTVIAIKNKAITGYHTGTLDDHKIENGTLPVLTKKQEERLKEIYYNLFE